MNSEAATARVPCRPSQASAAAGAAKGCIKTAPAGGGKLAGKLHRAQGAGGISAMPPCVDSRADAGLCRLGVRTSDPDRIRGLHGAD
jgi:hypothetical protein